VNVAPEQPVPCCLAAIKKSFELLICLCCKAAINLNFCVSLTTLSKGSSRRGCMSFQLAADLGFSSWIRRAQLSACSRSASMTIVDVFSLPNFWTWSRHDTWRLETPCLDVQGVSVVATKHLKFGLRHVDTGVIILGCHFIFLILLFSVALSLDLLLTCPVLI
jgi:hypothetical protein